jgi:hypothetical protein
MPCCRSARPGCRRRLLIGFVLLVSLSCIKAPKQTPMMSSSANLQPLSTAALRLKVYAFVVDFSETVEATADKVIQQSSDPTVRRRALGWKSNVIAESQRAAFQSDPLAGLIDLLALCGQQVQFFAEGGGADFFGPQQPFVLQQCESLDERGWVLGRSISVSGEVTKMQSQVAEWVRENPIDDLLFTRKSTRELLAEVSSERGTGASAVIGDLGQTVSDLSDRLTIYAQFLPKQARWQAQVLLDDTIDEAELRSLGPATRSLAESLDRIASTVERMPDVVTAERSATLDRLDALSGSVLASVDHQRQDTIDELRAERVAVLEAMTRERVAVLQAIYDQRVDTLDRSSTILATLVEDAFDRADGLIDRVFWRSMELLGSFAVMLLIVGLLVARGLRPRLTPR